MTVLLVDDSGLSRKVQAKVLREVGLSDIIEAKNGLDALRKLQEIDFEVELILTDWNMPGMDGMQLIERLRQHPKARGLPIIVISSEGEEERISQAFAVGASSYVTKPFKKAILARKIETVRSIAEIERTAQSSLNSLESGAPHMEGDLMRLNFAELVGFLNFSKKTGELLIDRGDGPPDSAGVSFSEGEVSDAWHEGRTGVEAFHSLAALGSGHFRFYEGRPPRAARVTQGTLSLLMEAMRILDEGAQ